MIVSEAIVLAGGLGTRLQKALPGIPKCLAPVAGKPFIQYVIQHLQQEGIRRFVFALGYQANRMIHVLDEMKQSSEFIYAVEKKPLGTGGAIIQSLQKCTNEQVLIINGDTFFNAKLKDIIAIHEQKNAGCTIQLKAIENCSRYGTVTVNERKQVTGFGEKNYSGPGFINAGMYLLNKSYLNSFNWPANFSFEKDFLQAKLASGKIYGVNSDAYFIDIGIPEDYEKAKVELPLVVGEW